MKLISIDPLFDFTSYLSGRELVALGVGNQRDIYLLFAQKPTQYRTTGKDATFAITRPKHPQSYRLICVQNGTLALDVNIADELFNIHFVQPLGDLLVLACGRCRYANGEAEQNGRLYDRQGRFAGALVLGDGIQDLQADENRLIWASYFDEGIFGNFGWDKPLGASGLVGWDESGAKRFAYTPSMGLEQICDCYAMNVANPQEVWISYYMDFPLVQLRAGAVHQHWFTTVEGSSAIAVDDGYCLFKGGYENQNAFTLAQLHSNGQAQILGEFMDFDQVVGGLPLEHATGRGDTIYFTKGCELFQLGLATALAQV